MKTVLLDINKTNTPKQIGDFLKKENIHEGDTLSLSPAGVLNQSMLLAYLIIIFVGVLAYLKAKKEIDKKKSEKLLDEVFEGIETPEQLKEEFEKELHINIQLPQTDDRSDWYYASALSLSKAYGENEPDYDNVVVKEPNPEYKPWKKDQ